MSEDPKAAPVYLAGFRLAVVLLSLFLGTFLVAIDTTIISVAISEISTHFHALNDIGWYGSAYLISLTALQLAGGTIYKVLQYTMGLFDCYFGFRRYSDCLFTHALH